MSDTRPPATPAPDLGALTPAAIVAELDRHIVGQGEAKRALAIALRNRYRRQLAPPAMREAITPKNILMIGPTGVGKTELVRQLARLIDAPFVKVEATTFTEVGYVGRDVESMVTQLAETSVHLLHRQKLAEVQAAAEAAALSRLVGYLADQSEHRAARAVRQTARAVAARRDESGGGESGGQPIATLERRLGQQRRHLAKLLAANKLDDEQIDLEVEQEIDWATPSVVEVSRDLDLEEMHEQVQEVVVALDSVRRRARRLSVREARPLLTSQEADRLIDPDEVVTAALERAGQVGIIFIDELDKIVGGGNESGPDVSGEGVQRDLLPIIEGAIVNTRHGPLATDHVLFIAAGAFERCRPSDLIPELQGRFPLRVELGRLSEDDLYAILTEPEQALTRQYAALLATEGVTLEFTEEGLRAIARHAASVNQASEDIGARRLQTIMEQVLEEISFGAAEHAGETAVVDAALVEARLGPITADEDLSNFIL